MAQWMIAHNQENPLYTQFDDLCDIMSEYDVSFSLGDSLRPGCIADASDAAQFAELEPWASSPPGPGTWLPGHGGGSRPRAHGPDRHEHGKAGHRVQRSPLLRSGAAGYGYRPGYDHITSAIGAALAGWHGASMLCYVTPKEHLGLPEVEDVRQGVIAYKIAAHAADLARHRPGARDRDDAISRARYGSTGKTSSACRSTRRPPAGCMTRRCPRMPSRPRPFAACAVQVLLDAYQRRHSQARRATAALVHLEPAVAGV